MNGRAVRANMSDDNGIGRRLYGDPIQSCSIPNELIRSVCINKSMKNDTLRQRTGGNVGQRILLFCNGTKSSALLGVTTSTLVFIKRMLTRLSCHRKLRTIVVENRL